MSAAESGFLATPGFLVDTNTVSETMKRRPHPLVLEFFSAVPGSTLFLSVLTLGELRKGSAIKRGRDPQMANVYSAWIDRLERSYGDHILDVSRATATLWGELSADRSRPAIDTLLAATAIVHGLTLVTRNTIDFRDLPVKLLNPWDE